MRDRSQLCNGHFCAEVVYRISYLRNQKLWSTFFNIQGLEKLMTISEFVWHLKTFITEIMFLTSEQ